MRRQRHREGKLAIKLRLWTYAEAVKVIPYLRSIVRSVREGWLESRQTRFTVQRLDAQPGRPNRSALILRVAAAQEALQAEGQFMAALRELQTLGVYCVDPVNGLALIPFRPLTFRSAGEIKMEGEDLAWFVFDLFAPQGLVGWRFHGDPLETRRPLMEELDPDRVDQVFSSPSVGVSLSRRCGSERANHSGARSSKRSNDAKEGNE